MKKIDTNRIMSVLSSDHLVCGPPPWDDAAQAMQTRLTAEVEIAGLAEDLMPGDVVQIGEHQEILQVTKVTRSEDAITGSRTRLECVRVHEVELPTGDIPDIEIEEKEPIAPRAPEKDWNW